MATSILLLSGCKKESNLLSRKPDSLPYFPLFSPSSPFNTPIDSNPEIDPNSPAMVQRLIEEYEAQGMIIAQKGYTVNVFYAGKNTPRKDVVLLATWAPKRKLLNVPIPEYTTPDRLTDGSVAIIDTVNGCEYDFWQLRIIKGRYYASWGNAIPLNSNGVFEKGYSARGSGFALTAGIIWPQELKAGQINHALIFSYSSPKFGGPVAPATESDGYSDEYDEIPEGALVQLNPDLNLDSLGLTGYEKTIARALQQYGMYCADAGGSIQLYVVNPESVAKNPYQGILPDTIYVPLTKIPVNEFRVIKMAPQNPDFELKIIENSCATFH